jgi:hypothetical protein
MAIGECPESAELHAIILCEEHTIQTAKKFFESKYAKDLCSSNNGQPFVKVTCVAGTFDAKATDSLELLGAISLVNTPYNHTSCGTLVKNSALPGRERYATMGGLITLTMPKGPIKIVGLTAGHFLETPDTNDDSEMETMDSNLGVVDDSFSRTHGNARDFAFPLDETLPQSSPSSAVEVYQDLEEGKKWSKLGFVSDASKSERAMNRDWALVENLDKKFRQPNYIPENSDNPTALTRVAKFAEFGSTPGSLSSKNEVFVLFNNDFHMGLLSGLPSAVLLPSGEEFVDIYTMSLGDDLGQYIFLLDFASCPVKDQEAGEYQFSPALLDKQWPNIIGVNNHTYRSLYDLKAYID